jgi:hypothetical protein
MTGPPDGSGRLATAAAASSPLDYDADVVLRGGSTVRVRGIRSGDETRLAHFFRGLSSDSRALRFLGAVNDGFLDRAAARVCNADSANTVGLVVTVGAVHINFTSSPALSQSGLAKVVLQSGAQPGSTSTCGLPGAADWII